MFLFTRYPIARYRGKVSRLYFRADAGFANLPELEEKGRFPAELEVIRRMSAKTRERDNASRLVPGAGQ